MNLSALNTGLNQATVNNSPEVNTSGNTSLRLPTGALSGEDFAAFLRNQVRALQHSQRPEIAAAPVAKPLPPAERATPSSVRADTEEPDNQSQKTQIQDKHAARQAQNKAADAAAHESKRLDKRNGDSAAEKADLANAVKQVIDQTDPSLTAPAQASTNPLDAQSASDRKTAEDALASLGTSELTTIPLSPSINIITVAKTTPDEKSLSDFALAMGLDPNQVLALFGPTDPSKALPNAVTTQQMLAMNGLPAVAAPSMPFDLQANASKLAEQVLPNVAVSTADFQAMKADDPSQADASMGNTIKTFDILNMQVVRGPAPTVTSATAPPVSTLAVLSMMDTQLRAEDIDALKSEFDSVTAVDNGTNEHGFSTGTHTSGTSSANAPSKAAAAFVNNPDMAQTFDKLSQKLATELAGRMHEKLNAGEWKMKFALKPASLGLVDVQLEMRDGKLTAQFNADTNLTQDLIQSGSQRLKEALGQLGMNNASVFVGQGQTQSQGQTSSQSGSARQGDDNRVKLADESTMEPLVQARPRHSNSLQFDNYA